MHLGLGEREMPFEAMTMSSYEDACRAAEVVVVVVEWLLFLMIRAHLGRDGEAKSKKGRHLRRAIPQLHLEAGDRLEPSAEVPDHGVIDNLTELPLDGLRLVFWRSLTIEIHYLRKI
ncbi:hypothetical protein N9L68_05225 [bacterium]|nr:hypothetical protein [bacterium]